MNRNSTVNYSVNYQPQDAGQQPTVSRLDMLKAQLHKLTPHQLAELRGAIDAKLDYQPKAVISDEEHAFLRNLF
ncbi:hypothetical protein BIY21_04830 [Vibrio ponticus]|uniref:Anti-sigma-28 factor FlgM C-terminal domain-containing protein n=1 Tax=Vibrio ponticus TaxID=265668 RepID=A0ABX3F4J5_9VIBR|nr:hypothetical protein [Vibrio ponticus]OLQ84854.1 hypothetical protein BIY21_04830 [Vibrio ponticus]